MKHVLTLFVVIIFLFPPLCIFADDVYTLEEIIVSATKTPERRMDIPNAAITKEKGEIETSGARTVGELLANEPGIDWQTFGNYGGAVQGIHIRGMRGDATQVFTNGVNINAPSLGMADVGKIPMDNIERIEVIKGSGSLLYGSGAMGGTVNIFTKSPKRDRVDLEVTAGYGTENTYRLNAQHGMFLIGDFGYYLTAGRTETDGFRDNSSLRQNDASIKLVLDRGELINISLFGDYIYREYGVPGVKPPRGTQEYSIGGTSFYNGEAASLLDRSRDRDGNIVLEVGGHPVKQFSYNLKGYSSSMENHNYERWVSTGGTGSANWITNKVSGITGHAKIMPLNGVGLLIGGEYKDIHWENKAYDLNTVGQRTAKTKDSASLHTKGIFAEGEFRYSPYLKVIAGIRHEDNSAFGTENIPRFGLVVNPSETIAFKVNHGRHFKAPTPNDLYWPAGPFTSGNPDLKPEIGWHSDVTYEHSLLKDRVFLTLSYFRWNVDNKIQWEPDSSGLWVPINLGGFKADGIEAGVRIGPFHNFSVALNYTYTDAEEKNREYTKQDYGWPPFLPPDFRYNMVKRRATMVPQNQFKGEFTYKTDFGLSATLTGRYVGDRVVYRTEYTAYPDTDTVKYRMGPYWTVDMRLEQRFYDHWTLSLDGKNLLNDKYETQMGTFVDRFGTATISGYPGAGRSVYLGLSYRF